MCGSGWVFHKGGSCRRHADPGSEPNTLFRLGLRRVIYLPTYLAAVSSETTLFIVDDALPSDDSSSLNTSLSPFDFLPIHTIPSRRQEVEGRGAIGSSAVDVCGL